MVNQKVAARLQVGPNCLLFFIDETGHETFADKNYPVFGLGGCAINSCVYQKPKPGRSDGEVHQVSRVN
jgi:uncharacterized protein DUF3800